MRVTPLRGAGAAAQRDRKVAASWDARSRQELPSSVEGLMPDPTLCFAAGSPKRPNSGVWRLWTHGPDTYLAARVAAHLFKLSMHKSGQWISAFTSQSGVVVGKETGSRRQGHVDPSSIHQKQGARNGA